MKNDLFVDISAFMALNDAKDQHYQEAMSIASNIGEIKFVISDAVISETYTILRYRLGQRQAFRFLSTVLDSKEYEIVAISNDLRKLTLDLLEKYNDHKISYCDALSAAIMAQYKIPCIFTFDHHFEILGVKRLFFKT
ncbi:putative nucleic acid-binding protein [Scopulibacillus darangshiensis]|uniref:Putative nucleic acid-binding protein n=1 Tax=Scopulibacillus darangshiensis TaxID=442528 RepID=A0A4R2NPV0_9BACL|nr:PIN domain-containing protein [Scopulibacillus darangshiensis]TCP23810.1 putative nucleic acid-binding protein [Scopulibacillus darangshiensis]